MGSLATLSPLQVPGHRRQSSRPAASFFEVQGHSAGLLCTGRQTIAAVETLVMGKSKSTVRCRLTVELLCKT